MLEVSRHTFFYQAPIMNSGTGCRERCKYIPVRLSSASMPRKSCPRIHDLMPVAILVDVSEILSASLTYDNKKVCTSMTFPQHIRHMNALGRLRLPQML